MGSGHAHDCIDGRVASRARLAAVLGVTATVFLIEVVGAAVTRSLALLADAGHMLTDVAGLAVALAAASLALRPAAGRRTFGNHRFEVLAAAANAVLLFAVGGYVLVEAVRRFNDPPEVPSAALLFFGLAGLLGNLVSLRILNPVRNEGLNVRGAFLEVLGDALGSAAVVLAAAVIWLTGWQRADVVASVGIALLILPRTWRLFRESVDVLLEAAPKDLDLSEVRRHILRMDSVLEVHDVHAWVITSGMTALSAHVVVGRDAQCADGRVLDRLADCLRVDFGIEHSTFQLEPAGHRGHEHAGHD
ncbi:MAG: cation transporter [Geodermatophilaceae bacterium]|nr:cation transporter [Geodermatophilaceae bacterium]